MKGNEYDKFLCLLKYISRVFVKQRCLSPHCPRKDDNERLFYTFSLPSCDVEKHLYENFPSQDRVIQGYCSAKFLSDIPEGCNLNGLNDHLVIEENGKQKREKYYECKGNEKVIEAHFTSTKPWIIPVSISNLHGVEIMKVAKELNVYGRKFVLGGCSLYSCDHFTAIIYWHNRPYYYDGLYQTKEQRFLPFNSDYNMVDKEGGFAYYFLSS